MADAVSKTSFDGLYGRIACISYAFDDEAPKTFASTSVLDPFETEFSMLHAFYSSINERLSVSYHDGKSPMDTVFCGHNIAGFDLPFLKARSIILAVKPPSVLIKAMNAKPWDICIADTMLLWNPDSQKRASMDKICKAFGIDGKDDFDGSMVAETWPVDPQKVIDYCEDDVRRTRAMYKRMTFS